MKLRKEEMGSEPRLFFPMYQICLLFIIFILVEKISYPPAVLARTLSDEEIVNLFRKLTNKCLICPVFAIPHNTSTLKQMTPKERKIVRKNNGIPRVVDLLDVDMNKVVMIIMMVMITEEQDQLFTSSSCTTLNVRQKIILTMLRPNYPLT